MPGVHRQAGLPSPDPATKPSVPAKPFRNRGRGSVIIASHFSKVVHRHLRMLGVVHGCTVQCLLGEALNKLFLKHGKLPLAWEQAGFRNWPMAGACRGYSMRMPAERLLLGRVLVALALCALPMHAGPPHRALFRFLSSGVSVQSPLSEPKEGEEAFRARFADPAGAQIPALHWAAAQGDADRVKGLLDSGADVHEQETPYGGTALH